MLRSRLRDHFGLRTSGYPAAVSASARRLRSLASQPSGTALRPGARLGQRLSGWPPAPLSPPECQPLCATASRGFASDRGCAHSPSSSSSSPASTPKSSPPPGSLALYAQKGRKVLYRFVGRLTESSKWFVHKVRVLSYAFVKNPLIVIEWYEDIRDAVVHFGRWVYTGFKLFGADVRASWRLSKRVIKGHPLTVRQRRLLVRTTSDCLKLIPFSFFIIVPFAEIALPFFLRLFPNMLPSTFFEQKYDNATLARKLKAKQEMADFWQQVMAQRTKELSESDEYADKAEELKEFQEKLMEGKEFPSLKEILRFTSVFKKEMTLENMSTKQLNAMSKMLGLSTSSGAWWQGHLEVQLRHHITNLRREDRDLFWEGVGELKGAELIEACRKRAIRFHGVSEDEMRDNLNRWLRLSANHRQIPTSMLLWIQSFYLRDVQTDADDETEGLQLQVKADDDANPEEAFHSMAERQKDAVEKAQHKLDELQREIDEVTGQQLQDEKPSPQQRPDKLADVPAKAKAAASQSQESSLEQEAGDDSQDDNDYACPEAERRKVLKHLHKADEDVKLYKEVVLKQKALLDSQLRFLLAMRDNKPTCQKDADVILLDQRVRLLEMIGSFEQHEEDIDKLFDFYTVCENEDAPEPEDLEQHRADARRLRRKGPGCGWADWGSSAVAAAAERDETLQR